MLNASVGVQRVIGRLRRPPNHRRLERHGRSRFGASPPHARCGTGSTRSSRRRACVPTVREPPRRRRSTRPAGDPSTARCSAGSDPTAPSPSPSPAILARRLASSASRPATRRRPPAAPTGAGPGAADRGRWRRRPPAAIAGHGPASTAASAASSSASRIRRRDPDDPASGSPSSTSADGRDRAATGAGRRRRPVPRGRHAGQAGRRRHDRRRRQRPGQTYKVKAGDTLAGIARKFGVSMMTVVVGEQPQVEGRPPGRPGPAHPAGHRPHRHGHRDRHARRPRRAATTSTARTSSRPTASTTRTSSSARSSSIPGAKGKAIPTPQARDQAADADHVGGSGGGSVTRARPPTRRQVPVAGRRRRQLHQPVLPLRPLRDRHRRRLRLDGPRRRRPGR